MENPALSSIRAYCKELDVLFRTGTAREHSYRPAAKSLLQSLLPRITVINEPARVECGAPDFMLLWSQTPISFIEFKDMNDGDLDGLTNRHREQFNRYKESLSVCVFSDYLDWHLYEDGQFVDSVRIAETRGPRIVLLEENIERFVALIEHIGAAHPQRITGSQKLAKIMAAKARLLRDVIERAILSDGDEPTELNGYMNAFRQVLIHDITPQSFADIYAQTIAYGMFAARLHDATPEDFTRQEAANLIPRSNPFLRKIFQSIAGYDLDDRIAWIVDDLVAAFAATDMERIMSGFGQQTQQTDPMLHFYEDFLFHYDPATKKSCGVYYTPQPVVNFIVRAVDDLLRTEFECPMGLADTQKIEVEREIEQDSKHRREKVQMHRVQVLDPATGTGTFLAEVVRQIKRNLSGQLGAWPKYVTEHLVPRLHGFELMMAPYTIAHLKLDMEIGVPLSQRLKVYLTNSLEEHNDDAGTLFGSYLAEEANSASRIKRDAPIMVMIGNPPYSVSSHNKGEWINGLMNDYKKNLNERNIQPLSDDYLKFIRLGQHYVERNKEGILAYISNNSFIDGLIHRQMRHELMRCFDKIYILDLHGNTRRKETCPDGSKDDNVFDIMAGVSINIFVKTSNHCDKEAEVYHYDLYGARKEKYAFLSDHDLSNTGWLQLNPVPPYYFFVPKNFTAEEEYNKGFKVDELMKVNACGIVSARDQILINFSKEEAIAIRNDFQRLSEIELKDKYSIADSRDWTLKNAQLDFPNASLIDIDYRPFDRRKIFYSPYSKGTLSYPRYEIMRHIIGVDNLCMNICKQQSTFAFQHVLVTQQITDKCTISSQTKEAGYVFPLYLYPDSGSIDTERRPNLDPEIWHQISVNTGVDTTPEQVFDYIYGVLHSPRYRETYKEFLKVDFPRIPYPTDEAQFAHFVHYGHQLRELHLMHNVPQRPDLAQFNRDGSGLVEQYRMAEGTVWINADQCFENVPLTAWNAYIGGYQPAQKWLKDRKGRTLTFEEVQHYRCIITVLTETQRIMQEIDISGSAFSGSATTTPTPNSPTLTPSAGPTYIINHAHFSNSEVHIGTVHEAK